MTQRRQRVLVATMKDEGPFILEWLAFHYIIGFDYFVIYSNDCWDQTADILTTAAERLGIVRHYDNSDRHGRVTGQHHDSQRRAYQRATALDVVRRAEYVLVCDADEFLNIHAGDGTLDALIADAPPFDAMSFTWRIFGTGGVQVMQDVPVIEQFTRCRSDSAPKEVRKWGVKTLFRPERVETLGVHRPYHVMPIRQGRVPIRWLNGSGEDVSERYRNDKWFATAETHGARLAEMNHYAIKSSEAFLMKKRRGSANSGDADRLGLDYLSVYDHNEDEDRSIQRHLPAVKAQVAQWCAQVPELLELHEATFLFHKSMVRSLRSKLSETSPAFMSELGLL